MALTKKDLENIGKVVDEKISANNTTLKKEIADDTKKIVVSETKRIVNTEIGLLRLEMNQRFDEAHQENQQEHRAILGKIEEIKTMESEDIQAIYVDIAKIKKRLPA